MENAADALKMAGAVLIFVVLVVLVPLIQVYMGGFLLSSYDF